MRQAHAVLREATAPEDVPRDEEEGAHDEEGDRRRAEAEESGRHGLGLGCRHVERERRAGAEEAEHDDAQQGHPGLLLRLDEDSLAVLVVELAEAARAEQPAQAAHGRRLRHVGLLVPGAQLPGAALDQPASHHNYYIMIIMITF